MMERALDFQSLRFANLVMGMLRDFIPEACHADAVRKIAETVQREGWQISNERVQA
jgi:hypothetical protein